MHIRSRSHVYQLPKNDSDWNVPEIVKAANGYIYNSLRWLEMKTYSHQAVLSSDEALIIDFIRTPPSFIRTCADECGNPIP